MNNTGKAIKWSVLILVLFFIIGLFSCERAKNTIEDVDQTAALRKVSISYNSMSFDIDLPPGALNGETFAELLKKDSSLYADPANYSISMGLDLNADNTADGARDAKFDGMFTDIIFGAIASTPVTMETDAFTVPKNEVLVVPSDATINLATHKQAGLYIFEQIVEALDVTATVSPVLKYKIDLLEGEINIPDFTQDIPTRASDDTKAFLRGLLDSGIFDEE